MVVVHVTKTVVRLFELGARILTVPVPTFMDEITVILKTWDLQEEIVGRVMNIFVTME
jgi:hypothetical protein